MRKKLADFIPLICGGLLGGAAALIAYSNGLDEGYSEGRIYGRGEVAKEASYEITNAYEHGVEDGRELANKSEPTNQPYRAYRNVGPINFSTSYNGGNTLILYFIGGNYYGREKDVVFC